MPVEKNLNKKLKKMWSLDEKIEKKENLNKSEKKFYNRTLKTIKDYYEKNNKYWKKKRLIKN